MADNNNKPTILDFGEEEKGNSIIKVIGVGGGGGNAVNHMYRDGIHDVTFVLCNTDNQALNDSPVPVHLQLGKEGLGAGNKPERARQAAEPSTTSETCLMMVQKWLSSLQVWVVELVQVQLLSSLVLARIWVSLLLVS